MNLSKPSIGCVALFALAGTAMAQQGPVVSNVTAVQLQDYSRRVEIHYDLASSRACTVWFMVSADGGATFNVPAYTYCGDIGPAITPGIGKSIIWDAGADVPGKTGSFRIRVYADDGSTQANMVFVPGGNYPYQNSTPIYVAPFWIDKYEVTNQRYCEFLNSADPNSDHWDSQQEITRAGTPPNVIYAVQPGRQNYPIRFVSYNDAVAMATWLTQREGRTYRLPTEQEWEKAASWDTSLQKHWTYGFLNDSIDCTWASFNDGNKYCVGNTTSEVGHYNGTAGTNDAYSYYGCYDMSGNVWEWTSGYDGAGNRILRGGSWLNVAVYCTSTYRNYGTASDRYDHCGFRLVLDSN